MKTLTHPEALVIADDATLEETRKAIHAHEKAIRNYWKAVVAAQRP